MAGVITQLPATAVARKATAPGQAAPCLACRAAPAKHAFLRRGTAAQRGLWPAVAAVAAADVAADVDDLEEEEAAAATEGEETSTAGLGYALNFLWMNKNIAVAVDQVFSKGQRSPVTEYFFWPRKDAWEELKVALEGKPWISARDKILLLNRTTEVINFWQTEGQKPSIEEAARAFPDCVFKGS